MKISTRGRYGVRLVIALAGKYGNGPVFLKEIARAEGISEKYLGQIIRVLKSAGLVKSFRGAKGGYELKRPPAGITLREVFETLEGNLELVDCLKNNGPCRRHPQCVVRDVWGEATAAMRNVLEAVTLQEMLDRQEKRLEEAAGRSDMYHI